MFSFPLDKYELAKKIYKEISLMQYAELNFDDIEMCRNIIYVTVGDTVYKIEVTEE